jgi:hypothetical protein
MVALVIIATVSAATFRLQYQRFQVYERSIRLTEAVLLAQEKLAESQIPPLRAGNGRVQAASGEELYWEVEVSSTPHPSVHAVRVRVRREANAAPILEASTYVASP